MPMLFSSPRCVGFGALILLSGACAGDLPTLTSTGARIYVTSMASGDPIEHDGYLLSLDGQPGRRLGANGVLLFADLVDGPHTLTLTEITSGCKVYGRNPRTVEGVSGTTTQSLFLVNCSVPGTARILVQ